MLAGRGGVHIVASMQFETVDIGEDGQRKLEAKYKGNRKRDHCEWLAATAGGTG
jgi:hypothetical protein